MKALERLLSGLLLVAIVFEVMHWPYTGILLLVSLSAFSLYQFPVSFLYHALRVKAPWWIAFNLVSSLIFALFPIAILFLLMQWPGVTPIMNLCVAGSPVILAIAIGFLMKAKDPEQRLLARNRLYRAIIATLISLYLLKDYFSQ